MGDEVEVQQLLNFIREQVPDWDDEVKTTARFKAFSGQRSDWESLFVFWRDLIISVARRFNLLLLSPSLMKNSWFNRGGLTPLCLDHVLLEMYNNGDLLRLSDFEDPTSGRLSQLLMKIIHFPIAFKSPTSSDILNDRLILLTMLEDRATYVVKALSETNWTSSCIITIKKFESLFKEHDEAFAVLSYLSRHGKALYLSIKSTEPIIGVKVSLSSASVSSSPSIDSVILQLMWTLEELQQQLSVIDEQYKRFRISALAALRSGDKTLALRNARQLKLASESREKLTAYSDRVEETVRVISDAQSAKKVYEAIQLGAQVIKENKMEVEEVQLCLQELDEFMVSQETIYNALESKSYAAVEDEDIEEELKKLESQIRDEDVLVTTPITMEDTKENVRASATPDDLCAAVADLKLESEVEDRSIQGSGSASRKDNATLEAA